MGEISFIPEPEKKRARKRTEIELTRPAGEVPVAKRASWFQRFQAKRAEKKARREALKHEQASLRSKQQAEQAASRARAQAAKQQAALEARKREETERAEKAKAREVDRAAKAMRRQKAEMPMEKTPPRVAPEIQKPMPSIDFMQDVIPPVGQEGVITPPTPVRATHPQRAIPPSTPIKPSVPPTKKKKRVRRPELKQPEVEPPATLLDVNLIPREVALEGKPKNRWRQLLTVAVGSLAISGMAYGGLVYYQYRLESQATRLQADLDVLDKEVLSYTKVKEEATAVNRRLDALTALLDQHITYDPLFTFLETTTLPTVYFSAMAVNAAEGRIDATAVAGGFDQIRAQEAVWRTHQSVKDVRISSATSTVPSTLAPPSVSEEAPVGTALVTPLTFSLSMDLDPDLFRP